MRSSRLRLVAAMKRTSLVSVSFEPTREKVRSWRKRSSFTCTGIERSPISSRKSVPPFAASARPIRRSRASVNAPFSWPKSSDSTSASGSAAQLRTTNGRSLRCDRLWIACATSSLPVPLSPRMSTVAPLGATWRICS